MEIHQCSCTIQYQPVWSWVKPHKSRTHLCLPLEIQKLLNSLHSNYVNCDAYKTSTLVIVWWVHYWWIKIGRQDEQLTVVARVGTLLNIQRNACHVRCHFTVRHTCHVGVDTLKSAGLNVTTYAFDILHYLSLLLNNYVYEFYWVAFVVAWWHLLGCKTLLTIVRKGIYCSAALFKKIQTNLTYFRWNPVMNLTCCITTSPGIRPSLPRSLAASFGGILDKQWWTFKTNSDITYSPPQKESSLPYSVQTVRHASF
jgi:hypothetical protein